MGLLLCIYCILLLTVVFTLIIFGIFYLRQVTKVSYIRGGWVLLVGISLRGLPPLIGFLPKWGVFISCIGGVNIVCILIIMLSSVVGVYFYLRARFTSILVGIGRIFNFIGFRLGLVINLFGL